VKLETTLVTVPVVASDKNGNYIPDLKKEDFTISEDGVNQEIAFFAAVKEPFNVVLMLDMSASTGDEHREIQKAARDFVDQLEPADRVKVISFDDQVRDLGDFTSDRTALKQEIDATKPGQGTKLYDAVHVALAALARIEGRKAVVLFTDGVDMQSDTYASDDNLKELEESGVIFYPIRYDTREETERLVRQQQRQQRAGKIPDLGRRLPPTSSPPTVPGDTRVPQLPPIIPPLTLPPPTTGPLPRDRYPGTQGYPPGSPGDNYPDRRPGPATKDSTTVWLDGLYALADGYLKNLADASGGRLVRADRLISLPAAFQQIAAELRTQYAIGYYPSRSSRDTRFHKIKVRSTRKGAIIRARPGYRATPGTWNSGAPPPGANRGSALRLFRAQSPTAGLRKTDPRDRAHSLH
jgi:VWFA-related protein